MSPSNSPLSSVISSVFSRKKNHRTARPDLYLHVGLPKTGTTAIQSFLYHNRSMLMNEQGIYYPDSALHWFQQVPVVKTIISSRFPHAHFNKEIVTVDFDEWTETVMSQCKAHKCDKVLVSSEFFWAAPAMQSPLEYHEVNDENFEYLDQAVKEFKNKFANFSDIYIVIYLRRQEQWLESFFNQQISDGFTIPREEELLPQKIYLLYSENILLWQKYFGEANVIVRSYEQSLPDVVADFCNVLDIQQTGLARKDIGDTGASNPSLSPASIRVMQKAIEKNLSRELLDRLRAVLLNTSRYASRKSSKGAQGIFSPDFLNQIQSIYREDSEKLVEQFPALAYFMSDPQKNDFELPSSGPAPDLNWQEQAEILLEKLVDKMPAEPGQ